MKPSQDFPFLKEYQKKFKTDANTIYAFDGEIYSDFDLPPDILIHELKHLERQEKIGADLWVRKYLEDDAFLLNEEVIAFQAQLRSVKDRNQRAISRLKCADALSRMYGGMVSYWEALKLL